MYVSVCLCMLMYALRMYVYMHGGMDRLIYDGWMDGWLGGWVGGWMDAWMFVCMHAHMHNM